MRIGSLPERTKGKTRRRREKKKSLPRARLGPGQGLVLFDSADGRPHGSSVEGAWFSSSPRASSRRAPFTFGSGETFERKRANRRNRRERARFSKPIAFSPTLSFASVSAASVLNVISARRYRVASKAPCARLRSHAASRSASAPSHSSSIKSHIAPRPRGKRREKRNEESGEERNSSQKRKETRVRREERDSSLERGKRLESGERKEARVRRGKRLDSTRE